jgi:predicted RecB family nuclease
LKGVGSEYADFLEAVGVDTVAELAQRNAANLAATLEDVNEAKKLVRRAPTEAVVTTWIAEAKTLPKAVQY